MDRDNTLQNIKEAIKEGNIDIVKTTAQEFNRQGQTNLCFTSRQMKGLRILEDVIEQRTIIEEGYTELIDEVIQIKYILETCILEMKCEKFSQTIQEFRL